MNEQPQEKPQEIHLVKSDHQVAADIVTSLVGLAIMWYVINPSAFDDVRAWARKQANQIAHKLSVWGTYQSIRSLPETEE